MNATKCKRFDRHVLIARPVWGARVWLRETSYDNVLNKAAALLVVGRCPTSAYAGLSIFLNEPRVAIVHANNPGIAVQNYHKIAEHLCAHRLLLAGCN